MNELIRSKLASYLALLNLRRGEAREDYHKVAPIYDDFAMIWDGYIAAKALAYYNQIIEQRAKPGAFILDAGAGTGERTLALLQHGQPGKIIALDVSEAMLSVARSKIDDPRVCYIKGDLIKLPFENDTFDLVSCTWAIETVADPRTAVREFIRVIKSNGLVICAFCSLPEGFLADVLKYVIDKVFPRNSPLTHFLSEDEYTFCHCDQASLKHFTGGLTTVATMAKCCPKE